LKIKNYTKKDLVFGKFVGKLINGLTNFRSYLPKLEGKKNELQKREETVR